MKTDVRRITLNRLSAILVFAILLSTWGCGREQNDMQSNSEHQQLVSPSALHDFILGELRLGNFSPEALPDVCVDAFVEQDASEQDRLTVRSLAEKSLVIVRSEHEQAKKAWPAVTDCDRLDRAENVLWQKGILLWQASPCCPSCTFGDLPDRVDEMATRHSHNRDHLRGYAFFTDQVMAEELRTSTHITVYLAYGEMLPDGSGVENTRKETALLIAREVCDAFRAEGLSVEWNGTYTNKIGLSLNWQRRLR